MLLEVMPPWWEVARIVLSTLMAVAFAVMVWRSRTAKIYREERDAAREQNGRLAEEKKALEGESAVLKEKVAVLEAQRDLTSVQEGQSAIVRAVESLAAHESERFTTMKVIFETHQQTAAELVTLLKAINESRAK